MILFLCVFFVSWGIAFNGNITFDDGSSIDLRSLNLSATEMLQVSTSCSMLGSLTCVECMRRTEQEFADAKTEPYLYNVGLASCLYTRAFSMFVVYFVNFIVNFTKRLGMRKTVSCVKILVNEFHRHTKTASCSQRRR